MFKFYIYTHTRKDSQEIFYVGIGTKYTYTGGNTNIYSRAYSKNRNIFWKRIVEKTDYTIDIIFESNSYEEIKNKEIELIKLYGRRDLGLGTLCNLTDGGEGTINYIRPESSRKKLSDTHKKLHLQGKCVFSRPNHYENLSQILKGNQHAKGSIRTKEGIDKLRKGWDEKLGKRIIQEDLEGNFIKEWFISRDIISHFGISKNAISKACKGYEKGATSCGFKWKYKKVNK